MVGMAQSGTKQYGRNLWGICALVGGSFILFHFSSILMGAVIAGGTWLIGEHIFLWGKYELWDFVGHEWVGLIMITVAFLFGDKNFLSLFGFALVVFCCWLNLYKGKDAFSKELKRRSK